MMWYVAFLLIFFVFSIGTSQGQTVSARFVALEALYKFSNPKEPVQRFIVELRSDSTAQTFRLVKVIYLVPTKGTRDSVELIRRDKLDYRNIWRMKLAEPGTEREKKLCSGMDNYSRDNRGRPYLDKHGEPIPLFAATRFDADIIFDDLSKLPCFVLEGFQPQED